MMTDPNTPHGDEGVRHQIRETSGLVGDVLAQVTKLVRGEMDLFRAEVDENLRKAGAAVGMIVAGVVILLTALNVLASALVAGLVELGIDAGWSALIVGVLFAVIAGLLAKKGLNDLKLKSLAPTRTAKNVRRDGEAVKEAV
ncbi:phage holin family protein [Pacificitalea manganoxidans]